MLFLDSLIKITNQQLNKKIADVISAIFMIIISFYNYFNEVLEL